MTNSAEGAEARRFRHRVGRGVGAIGPKSTASDLGQPHNGRGNGVGLAIDRRELSPQLKPAAARAECHGGALSMQMKGLRYLIAVFAFVFALVGLGSAAAFAAVPTLNFTMGTNGQPVPAPPPYKAVGAIYTEMLTYHGQSLGQLNQPQDILIGPNGNLWIVDTQNNRVIEIADTPNANGVPQFTHVLLVIGGPNATGESKLNKPQGVAIGPDGLIYIADTGDGRVAVFAPDGTFLTNLNPSASATWKREKVPFNPTHVAVGPNGGMYITIPGQTFGVAHFNSNGRFLGFFAPNHLGFTATLFYDLGQLLTSQAQKNQKAIVSQPEVNNVYEGPDGYLYTTSLSVNSKQIRRLNSVGTDTLNTPTRHLVFALPFTSLPFYVQAQIINRNNGTNFNAKFVSVGVQSNGVISALDTLTDFVYQYGRDGKLLYTFGGQDSSGKGVLGLFENPTSVAVTSNGYVLVADALEEDITVFQPTQFAALAQQGISLYTSGHYRTAETPWRQILQMDANYDLAHDQLALGYLSQGELLGSFAGALTQEEVYFSKAIHQYYLAKDQKGFGTAFGWYRHVWMRINFTWVFAAFLATWLLVYLLVKFGGPYLRKHPLVFHGAWARGQFARIPPMMWRVVKHPAEAFFQLKYEDQGTLAQGVVLIVLAFVVHVANLAWTDFQFSTLIPGRSNLTYTAAQFLLPLGTWIVANYLVGDLYDGEANLAEVLTGSAYALVPFILLQLPYALFSHALVPTDGVFKWLYLFQKLWIIYMFFTQVRVLHNLEWGKAVKASLMTLIGIGVIWTMILIVVGLGAQAYDFVTQIMQDIALLRS